MPEGTASLLNPVKSVLPFHDLRSNPTENLKKKSIKKKTNKKTHTQEKCLKKQRASLVTIAPFFVRNWSQPTPIQKTCLCHSKTPASIGGAVTLSGVSARDARPPSSLSTYGHLLLESNDTTILPARRRGGRAAPPHPSGQAGQHPPVPGTAPPPGEPGRALHRVLARELLPRGAGHGRHGSPSGAAAYEWGSEEQGLRPAGGFTSSASRRAAGSGGPHRLARSRLPAHLGTRTRSGPPRCPPPTSYSGGAGRPRAGHRPLPMAAPPQPPALRWA